MTKFESHEETPVNLYGADFKEPFPNNFTILMLHIIPNRKLHTINFQMAYNVAVCTVDPLNSTKIGFGHSTIGKISISRKCLTTTGKQSKSYMYLYA